MGEKVGDEFSLHNYINGKILELVVDQKIVQSWRGNNWPEGWYSNVTFTFSLKGTDTLIDFTQLDIPEEQASSICQGWYTYYWDPLIAYLTKKNTFNSHALKVTHLDIPAKNLKRIAKFYNEVFGWQTQEFSPEYFSFYGALGGVNGGFRLEKDGEIGKGHSPVYYIDVTNLDETAEKMKKAGAHVVGEKKPIPGHGWISELKDTEGNVVGLFMSSKHVKTDDSESKMHNTKEK